MSATHIFGAAACHSQQFTGMCGDKTVRDDAAHLNRAHLITLGWLACSYKKLHDAWATRSAVKVHFGEVVPQKGTQHPRSGFSCLTWRTADSWYTGLFLVKQMQQLVSKTKYLFFFAFWLVARLVDQWAGLRLVSDERTTSALHAWFAMYHYICTKHLLSSRHHWRISYVTSYVFFQFLTAFWTASLKWRNHRTHNLRLQMAPQSKQMVQTSAKFQIHGSNITHMHTFETFPLRWS